MLSLYHFYYYHIVDDTVKNIIVIILCHPFDDTIVMIKMNNQDQFIAHLVLEKLHKLKI